MENFLTWLEPYIPALTTALNTIILATISYVVYKIKVEFKIAKLKDKEKVELLTSVNDRENYAPRLDEQTSAITQANANNVMLAEMLNTFAQETNLPVEAKEKVVSLYNNIKFGNNFTTVSDLKRIIEEQTVEIESLKQRKLEKPAKKLKKARR